VPTQADDSRRLRRLHDEYAWRVNAAIAEGREDLVWRLSDAYLEEAMQLMAQSQQPLAPLPRPAPPRHRSLLTRIRQSVRRARMSHDGRRGIR